MLRAARCIATAALMTASFLAATGAASVAGPAGSAVQIPDTGAVAPASAKESKPTWKTWHCGYRSDNGIYQCKRWFKYTYCGGTRPMRLVQRTKMDGKMWAESDQPPPHGGSPIWRSHSWRKSATAKNRNMYVGQQSAYFYVWTPKKPDAKPYVICDRP